MLRARVFREDVEEAKRIRREHADWEFIEKQPPRIKAALKYYIETGDIRRSSHISGLDLEDFRELLRKARIPIVLIKILFFKRGDDSGTHSREVSVWRLAGLGTEKSEWYLSCGCGMSEALKHLNESVIQTPVRIEILHQVDYEETRIFAEAPQSRLRDINVELILNPQPQSQLEEIAKDVQRNPENTPHLIIADWWPTIPSPYDYLYLMFHSDSKEWNYAGYENEKFEDLIDYAWELEGTNYSEALSLYRRAQETLFNEVVGINLWNETKP